MSISVASIADRLAEERRHLILSAAATCIASQGYDNVRLRDVGRQAGVSVGLIQHYFDTRDELLIQAIGSMSEELLDAFSRIDTAHLGPWERLVALIDQVCSVTNIYDHGAMWVVFGAAVSGHPELAPHLERVYATWEHYVHDAVEEGLSNGDFNVLGDPRDAVAIFLAFFDGYEYDMGTGLVSADTTELRRRAIHLARALFIHNPPPETSTEAVQL